MTIKIRQRTNSSGVSHWQADIHVRLPNGLLLRERRRAPGSSRGAALRWAKAREAYLLRHGKPNKRAQDSGDHVTLADFYTRFKKDYLEAERLRPTTIRSWDGIMQDHIIPTLGHLVLAQVTTAEVQALKRRGLADSTTNLVLSKLQAMLRKAEDWGVIDSVPKISKLKATARHADFLDFEDYRRLVAAARELSDMALLVVLLAGDAGLRRGEILGLRWRSVHFDKNRILVCDNAQRGVLGPTKGGKDRWVPMTEQLRAALEGAERVHDRVITRDGEPHSASGARHLVHKAEDRAGLKRTGIHILRHTFCSHLAMKGVSAVKIQRLAGHANLSTTQIYMHLAPSTLDDAIATLAR